MRFPRGLFYMLLAVAAALPSARSGQVALAQTVTPIGQIQGAGHLSPVAGATVTAEGIVTATRSGVSPRGFYIQDAGDGNEDTSDGIFVFTSSAPAVQVGNRVRVTGRVIEFRPGGSASANLTITEFDRPTAITVYPGNNPLPAPATIPQPPTAVIDNDSTGSVETSGLFDPDEDGIDFYETFEGMRVRVERPRAVSSRNAFGEIAVVSEDWNFGPASPRGQIVIRPGDFNPERVIVDDENFRPGSTTPPTTAGDRFAGPLVGVMDYSFGNYKLQLTAMPAVVPGGLTAETTTAPRDQELAVATYNVLNLSPLPADAAQLARIADQIVRRLHAPDLIALQEMQDASGETDDGVTAGAPTFQALSEAILAAGGPLYEFRQIDPENNADGGVPGGNIRVGFLFRTDRGLSFIDRPGGDATTPTEVIATPSGPRLSISPGRIDPANAAWASPEPTRKPLVGEFRFRGKHLFVITVHLKSKSGDHPLFGRFQPPTQITLAQRVAQAVVVREFVRRILAADPHAYVIVLGDFNDFHFSDTLATLSGPPSLLVNLAHGIPEADRYTFVFDGNGQTLDHILVSPRIAARSPVYDIVHMNVEFPGPASDHDPAVARINMIGAP
ncbi:MAG TPA: endonuclease/exonuclease/phosphatase family protein [bacterium]|nr:endonuclease/exonuclease/phosphatase family protein [bacterium]